MILVTGSDGYIGRVMTKVLRRHFPAIAGLDCRYYEGATFYDEPPTVAVRIDKDIRDVELDDLRGVTSVVHLAALSNDALGALNPALTDEINHLASVRLARLAKEAGAERFLFSSSCSLYGVAGDERPLAEDGRLNPLTAYAAAKAAAERGIAALADDRFHPVILRNATAFGLSPNLRLDLVVNNLTAAASVTGHVTILSDGTPWRPLVHVEDICGAFLCALKAPADVVHNQVFNVGDTALNYRVREIAEAVRAIVPGSAVEVRNSAGSDERTYRVDCAKMHRALPDGRPRWSLADGIRQLHEAYTRFGLSAETFASSKHFRVRTLQALLAAGRLSPDLRWRKGAHA